MRRIVPVVALAVASGAVVGAGAQPKRALPHAKVTLLSELAGVPSGSEMTLGVRFQIDPGWHIYAPGPAEGGPPPEITWLATPLRMSPIRWPVPARVGDPDAGDFGYEGTVTLLVSGTPQASDGIGRQVEFKARVNYVVCGNACVKETTTISRTLDVMAGRPPRSKDAALFDEARARLPK